MIKARYLAIPGSCFNLLRLAVFSVVILLPALAQADTVFLKDGRKIDGDVIRNDDTQVVVLVLGQPQVFSSDSVDRVSYSRLRLAPSTRPKTEALPSDEPVKVDMRLLQQAKARLRTFHELLIQIRYVLSFIRKSNDSATIQGVQLAIQKVLPVIRGKFSPLCALADLFILLGLRAPTIWAALLFVRESRPFTRIAEFLVVAYGVTMFLMAIALGMSSAWIKPFIFPIALGGVGCIFGWMFGLELRRAVLAFLLVVGMNLGIEYLLIRAALI